jgi:tRNA-binding protein
VAGKIAARLGYMPPCHLLGSRRIAGFTSEFLVLGGLEPDGTVRLLGVDAGVEPGAPVA